jgi:hypothetical protein
MSIEEINNEYQRLCLILGDIEVKLKGLGNQKAHLFEELNKLDELAKKAQEKTDDKV